QMQRLITQIADVSGAGFHEVYRAILNRERELIADVEMIKAYTGQFETEAHEEAQYFKSWGFADGRPPILKVRPNPREITDGRKWSELTPKERDARELTKDEESLVRQIKKP